MSKTELLAYLIENNTNFSVEEVLIGSGVAILLSIYLFFVYKITNDSVKYSTSFNITLVMTALITTMVMMIIGSNLALSLGMVGALSIIRFRAAIKDPKDISFIFWAVAIGLSCGAGIYLIGVIGSVIISIFLFIFKFKKVYSRIYLLTVTSAADSSAEEIEACIKGFSKHSELKMNNVRADASDATYEIKLKDKSANELCSELMKIAGVSGANVVSFEGN